ncbi:type IV pilin protein [Alcanivorax sp. DP30]|uniref:type IV pilin protein n=1 Tax=Alcanivorax sp. DP30 TaxID=2606217 RepID=UPI001368E600|nr:type IV pilin protein [Alcanivorax sp. DP30]MZR61362.1 prepilin-type N-terminal cleavage/methylation domain-containing protein [Alcanivorax sp. DP30]
MQHKIKTREGGFSLIEILVVVMIVSILGAISYPSYVQYVQKSRQSDAQAEMMALAGALERYRAKNFSYNGATLSSLSPTLANSEFYSVAISIQGDGDQQYEISATPKGLMDGTEIMKIDSEGRTCMKKSSCTTDSGPHW